ncbi:MFS transporter [Dyadobacter frigoris]|uniref:MFS transporter n=1 Tax=Dyadobacter frigoris TaxID=2576211 RepID=A0A4U6CRA0_9BACT|nr:MFS transporter [Dyadobacter frigoris]TKT87049.1 MFS transporter [Dyadobacter frigoris]GLU52748.1 MFS transporter [Dyadobacter frigoris]
MKNPENQRDAEKAQNRQSLPPQGWFSIIIIVLLVILAMIDRNAINLMIDPIRKSLQINDFQIGLLQGPAFAVFFLIGSVLMGWMVGKYSDKWLIYVGATVWSLATIASGFSSTFTIMLVARCFVGLGESVLQPVSWNMVTRTFPKHRLATAISILTAGSQLGVAASFVLTGFLIDKATHGQLTSLPGLDGLQSWQWVFFAAGIPGLFLGAFIFFLPSVKTDGKQDEQVQQGGLIDFIKENRGFLICHFLGFGLLSIMVNGAAAWGPTYLIRSHGMDIKNISILLSAGGVPLGIGGVIFAGWLVDRAFKRKKYDAHLKHFAVRALIVAILGCIGFVFNQTLIVSMICFGLIQFTQPFSGVAGASIQLSVPEGFRARISAFFIMFYNALGMMAGPTFVALLNDSLGSGNLGRSIGINYMVLGCSAALLLWVGSRYASAAYLRFNQK